MKISFTGTRKGMTTDQKEILLRILWSPLLHYSYEVTGDVLIHGACSGADYEADHIAAELKIPRIIYPCPMSVPIKQCQKHGRGIQRVYPSAPPLERNKKIVEAGEILVACPKESKEILRSGTWATIRHARILKRQIILIFP